MQQLPETSDSHNTKPQTPVNDDVRGTDVYSLFGFKMFHELMFWRNKVGQ